MFKILIDVTNFADEAVVLPMMIVMTLIFLFCGWRRGILAWLAASAFTIGSIFALKISLVACESDPFLNMHSPSGHSAVTAFLVGVIATIAGMRRSPMLIIAALFAIVISITRVALAAHSILEVSIGTILGLGGAFIFASIADAPPRLFWLMIPVVAMLALFLHGHHLNAERHIYALGMRLQTVCSQHT